MYSPACFLLTLANTRGFSKKQFPVLTSTQETDGIGIPVTVQFNVAFLPSTAVTFSSCSMADRSENEEDKSLFKTVLMTNSKLKPI